MLDFSDRTRTGISILTSAADAEPTFDAFFLFLMSSGNLVGKLRLRYLWRRRASENKADFHSLFFASAIMLPTTKCIFLLKGPAEEAREKGENNLFLS